MSPQTPGSLPPGAVGVCGTAPQLRKVLLHWTISSERSPPGFRQQSWDEVQKLNADTQLHVVFQLSNKV